MLRLLCVFSALLLFTGCASGRRDGADANSFSDASPQDDATKQTDTQDASSTADAYVPSSRPDANAPDGRVITGDASTSIPDAELSTPDASVSVPDASVPNSVAPGALVINEIEVNCPGDDFEEFVEILNRSGNSINLRGVELVHINGASNNPELDRWALSSAKLADGTSVTSLAPGQLVVLAQQGSTVLANLPSSTPRLVHTTPLQNGPEVLQIEDGSGTLIDAVAYEDDIAGYGEGSSTPGDLGDDRGLSRCPAGSDTNDNKTDFVRAPLSPAAANNCP